MYDFCKELKNFYHDRIFDEESIDYYINGFLDALDVNLSTGNLKGNGFGKIVNILDGKEYESDEVEKNDKDNNLKIHFQKNKSKNKLWLNLHGMDNHNTFSLDIVDIKKNNVRDDLHVAVELMKLIDGVYYSMVLVSRFPKINIVVSRVSLLGNTDGKASWLSFNRYDFEFILKMTMKFKDNPVALVNLFEKLQTEYGVQVSSSNIENKFMDDIILDKSGKILEKVIK